MTPNQTITAFPEFADGGTKTKPGDAKYSAGFVEADVLPAEWLNWLLNKPSAAITEIKAGLESIEKELNNLLTAGGETADITDDSQVVDSIKYLRDSITGTLSNLTTTVKTTLVAAINEIDGDVGSLTTLTTTAKNTIVAAVNELNTNIGTVSSLTTSVKTSLVAAVNELVTNQGTLSSLTTTVKTSLVSAINELVTKTGTLTSLTTAVKTSLVSAINELVTNQGDLTSLNTTNKTSLVEAINENQAMFKKNYRLQCNSVSGTTNNALVIDNAPAFKLETGVIITVLFIYACTGSTSPTLNINNTGAKRIMVRKNGSTISSSITYNYGKFRGSTSYSYEIWQPYTILQMYYDGTDWQVIGNPIVESYSVTTAGSNYYSYKFYADGTGEQHYYYNTTTTSDTQVEETWTYPVRFRGSVIGTQVSRISDHASSNLNYCWFKNVGNVQCTFVYRKNGVGGVSVSITGTGS